MLNINLITRETLVHEKHDNIESNSTLITDYYSDKNSNEVYGDLGYASVCFGKEYYISNMKDFRQCMRLLRDEYREKIKYFSENYCKTKPIVIIDGFKHISTINRRGVRLIIPESIVHVLYKDADTDTYMLADYEYIEKKYIDDLIIDDAKECTVRPISVQLHTPIG